MKYFNCRLASITPNICQCQECRKHQKKGEHQLPGALLYNEKGSLVFREIRGPRANFCFGGPIFPENVGERGGGKEFFSGH
jgi:hypothetical protein